MGLYRYKRLIFGVNSAAEVFQQTIQTVLEGIKGAKNISEDIIFQGRDEEEHDQVLSETLKELHKSSQSTARNVNSKSGRQNTMRIGQIFNKEGISPGPEKVEALHEAARNQAVVRSFLGLARCCFDFIENFTTMTVPLLKLVEKDIPLRRGENN